MADLSAVLRKTIDGLPNASPELRAKVYDKARAAIERQIAAANPALPDELIEARRSALADAIDRTEDHYLDQESPAARAPEPAPPRTEPARMAPPAVALPHVDRGPSPSVAVQKPAWPTAPSTEAAARTEPRRDPSAPSAERVAPPVAPGEPRRAPEGGRADVRTPVRPTARREPTTEGLYPPSAYETTEPSSGLDTSAIPAADLAAPRYGNGRRASQPSRNRGPVMAGVLAVLVLGGGGALAYVYRDQIEAALVSTPATNATATATPAAGTSATAPATATAPAAGQVAAVAPAAVPNAGAPTEPASTRRFTQRLLPDGTEVDEGPGAGSASAIGEGTDIAAASPDAPADPAAAPAADGTTVPETAPAPEVAETPVPPPEVPVAPAEPDPAVAAAAPAVPTETAALAPNAGVPAVAQKAVFYEERTETDQGSQHGGNVVWSVVEESPSDGAPPEPAIRAVADVPDENIRLTMTIRRNADSTLPASHVIEMMFDVPANFPGGQIANVQRLALKPTEEARGEPLIGVAGKISDGFFIVALNNLAQATTTNLNLLGKEQWIDIPIAYATGRRALISIEKGIPGDRVFKQAMDAWAART